MWILLQQIISYILFEFSENVEISYFHQKENPRKVCSSKISYKNIDVVI